MRVVFNLISYAIPSVGVALCLWATFRWDMPVPLALTVVSLAWAYCLFLVVLTVSTASKDKKIEHVSLGRGIVESVGRRSQDSIEIRTSVGHVRRGFSALKGTVGQLARGDSVMFAYGQSGKIIRLDTIDTSTPGRIMHGGGHQSREEPESSFRFAGRTFNRVDFHNQAMFGTLVPGVWGALPTAILATEVWGWDWPWAVLFLALAGILIILFFVVANVEYNYGSIAKMELDIGYVQEANKWRQAVADNGHVVNQSIVIADSALPNGLNKRTHGTFDKTFAVHLGDLVILTTDHNGRISQLRRIEPEAATARRLAI